MADLSDAASEAIIASAGWDPKPLRRDYRPLDYPVERLPGLIGGAVQEVADFVQAPVAMVAGCALSAVSAAIQSHFSVSRNARLHGPASLYFLTVAESGERKSTVDGMFMKSISEWEAIQRQEEKRVLAIYEAEKAEFEKSDGDGDPPEKPAPTPRMLRGDDTSEALINHLSKYPIAAVISAEAGVIFGSHSMKAENVQRNLGLVNQLWDGGPVREGRAGRGETNIESVRVTMGLMLQPSVLHNFTKKTDGLARGIGFFARFLMCHPESTQGTRFYKDPPPMPALDAFQHRVATLLLAPAAQNELGRLLTNHITFDDGAQRAWIQFHDEVEEYLGGDREYSGIKDVASKAAENAARLACCLHVFTTQGEKQIGEGTMEAACELMRWYLDEAVRFGRNVEVTEEMQNAELLEVWLVLRQKEAVRAKQDPSVTVNTIRQKGPNALRDKRRVDDALDLLKDHGRIRLTTFPGSKSRYVIVAPQVIAEYS